MERLVFIVCLTVAMCLAYGICVFVGWMIGEAIWG
mgnify:CR=1 FL=1